MFFFVWQLISIYGPYMETIYGLHVRSTRAWILLNLNYSDNSNAKGLTDQRLVPRLLFFLSSFQFKICLKLSKTKTKFVITLSRL